jgi:SAM-dependent methyltransferase
MKPLYDFSHLQVDHTVAPDDGMVAPEDPQQYFDLGRRALELVQFSSVLCDKPHYPRILDLPCGHGRVLRWLRPHYHYAEITACDLDRSGVDFCHQRFAAIPVYSEPDLRQLRFPHKFDLIWVGSLLTHLPLDRWLATLECLANWTSECGVIVFSTQGRYYTSQLARGQKNIAENIDKAALLANFARDGFAYERYFEEKHGDYGVAVTSPEWLGRTLQRHPNLILRAYLEQAWGMQDVVILYKATDFYRPVLGTPELNTATPTPPGLLGRLLGRR